MAPQQSSTQLSFFTVGHSSHSRERFLALLAQHAVDVLIDTRSAPYSRFTPQFDRESLKESLLAEGRKYLWLGDRVGGRPREEECYDTEGHVLYGRVAELPAFLEAITRLERGAQEFRLALLCAEEDPSHCHRRLLVTRVLLARGHNVAHIRGDGSLDTDADITRKSGKPIASLQTGLFTELNETEWRSSSPIGKPAARSIFE